MPPPKKPAPTADHGGFDEEEMTETGAPLGDDPLGDIDFSDLDGLTDMPLDEGPPPSGRFSVVFDEFEDSKVHTDVRRKIQAEKVAPEVGQGPWRERAFTPRGVMSREQIIQGLEEALKVSAMRAASLKLDKVRGALKQEFLPLIRQAVEQAGGDGVDAWIGAIIKPPAKRAKDPMLMELVARMDRVNRAGTNKEVLLAGQELAKATARFISAPKLTRLSLKALELELEGRIDTEVILQILFSTDQELGSRVQSVDASLEGLRTQLRMMQGMHPDGLMSNFARLKVEKRVLEAELKRRAPRG